MKLKNKRSKGDYSVNLHGILYKKLEKCGKEFSALIVPKTIKKYVLHESHNKVGHNGTAKLYQFLKRSHYWKDLK